MVARRNARERKRVQAVNLAFMKLRKCVPVENRNKRLSKVKTLHRAIEYIAALDQLLKQQITCGQNFQYTINPETLTEPDSGLLVTDNVNDNNPNCYSNSCGPTKITFNKESNNKHVIHYSYLNQQTSHQSTNKSSSSTNCFEKCEEISCGNEQNLISQMFFSNSMITSDIVNMNKDKILSFTTTSISCPTDDSIGSTSNIINIINKENHIFNSK